MNIIEFKNRVNRIILFAARMNEEDIPVNSKKTIIKVYANTLKINLSDKMAENIIENIYTCHGTLNEAVSA